MNLNDFIVNIFCETDDFMKKFFETRKLRTRGPLPQLADSEVLTMEIVGEILERISRLTLAAVAPGAG